MTTRVSVGTIKVKWEMFVEGISLSGSNITVLVIDIIRKDKHEIDPVGRKSLIE